MATASLADRLSKAHHVPKDHRDQGLEKIRVVNEIIASPAWPALVDNGFSDGQLFAPPAKGKRATDYANTPMSVLASLVFSRGQLTSSGEASSFMITPLGQADPVEIQIISEGEPCWEVIGQCLDTVGQG
ncbi:MAG: hypothetical protein ACKVP7_26475 [Hyphomicrobiaceae bacterium]